MVQFAKGRSGVAYADDLTRARGKRYVLNATSGQFLDVPLEPDQPGVAYQIFNPDDTFLLDMIPANGNYRGQLFRSGDHVIEVINRADGPVSYRIYMSIDSPPRPASPRGRSCVDNSDAD